MHQCRIISYKICTTMGQDVNSAGAGACLGAGSIKEFSVITSQCCCEPKNTLKNKKIKKIIVK